MQTARVDGDAPSRARRGSRRERIWGLVGGIVGTGPGVGLALIAVGVGGSKWWTPRLYPEFSRRADSARTMLTSGLTQRQLAQRAETSQSIVARIEQGRSDPSTSTLARLLGAAGSELRAELTPIAVADTQMLDDVARILSLTPEERLLAVRNVSRIEAATRRV